MCPCIFLLKISIIEFYLTLTTKLIAIFNDENLINLDKIICCYFLFSVLNFAPKFYQDLSNFYRCKWLASTSLAVKIKSHAFYKCPILAIKVKFTRCFLTTIASKEFFAKFFHHLFCPILTTIIEIYEKTREKKLQKILLRRLLS